MRYENETMDETKLLERLISNKIGKLFDCNYTFFSRIDNRFGVFVKRISLKIIPFTVGFILIEFVWIEISKVL